MYVAIVLYVGLRGGKRVAKPTIQVSAIGDTLEEAAQKGVSQMQTFTVTNSGYLYETWVGELTATAEPASPPIRLVPAPKASELP